MGHDLTLFECEMIVMDRKMGGYSEVATARPIVSRTHQEYLKSGQMSWLEIMFTDHLKRLSSSCVEEATWGCGSAGIVQAMVVIL